MAVLLIGCQTSSPTLVIPDLTSFRPEMSPVLIDEPQTDVDLLQNSVAFEFLLYRWQNYADGLEKFIYKLGELRSGVKK